MTRRKTSVPKTVVAERGDRIHIAAVDAADVPKIARLLVDAADNPNDVSTTTAPVGWLVPAAVAQKAGFQSPPTPTNNSDGEGRTTTTKEGQ